MREGDLPAVARFLGEVYGANHRTASEAVLRWQYLENPLGPVVGTLAVTPQDEIVGVYTLTPLRFAVAGRPQPGMLSLNTATHPGYQGQGIFVRLAERAYEEAARRGAVGVIGFPNQNSLHGLTRRLGWSLVGRMRVWVRPRKVGTLVGAALRQRATWQRNAAAAAAGSTAERLADGVSTALFRLGAHAGAAAPVDGGLDELLRAQRPGAPLQLDYPAGYLRWRFGSCPSWRYEAACSPDGDAAVICRHDTLWGMRTTLLLDFGARWDRPAHHRLLALRAALSRACARAAEEDTAQMMTLVNPGHPAEAALALVGFVPVPERTLPHAAWACYKPLGGHPVPPDFPRWSISVGAYDAG